MMHKYRPAEDLTPEEIEELKYLWFYSFIPGEHDSSHINPLQYGDPENIPNEVLFRHYNGPFTTEEFYCNIPEEEYSPTD